MAHNIPDTLGFVLNTPVGKMVYIGDFKFDYDKENQPKGNRRAEKIGEQKFTLFFWKALMPKSPAILCRNGVVEKS